MARGQISEMPIIARLFSSHWHIRRYYGYVRLFFVGIGGENVRWVGQMWAYLCLRTDTPLVRQRKKGALEARTSVATSSSRSPPP
jgi:hypothetical protein